MGRLEYVIPAKHVGNLSEQRAELTPLERDLVEPEDGPAFAELPGEPDGIELEPGRGEASLNAALGDEELHLHIDGAGELGLRRLELPEGGQFG
jgi:hypothetical protein